MKIFKTVSVLLLSGLLMHADEVEELIQELGSGDKVKRREAARSLALLGPKAKAAVPALVKGLNDDEEQVFFWSATALAKIGPDAREASWHPSHSSSYNCEHRAAPTFSQAVNQSGDELEHSKKICRVWASLFYQPIHGRKEKTRVRQR